MRGRFEMTRRVKEVFTKPDLARKYNSLQPGWCAEMYGYVYAAAELRVKHTILPNLQIRDVDGAISYAEAQVRQPRHSFGPFLTTHFHALHHLARAVSFAGFQVHGTLQCPRRGDSWMGLFRWLFICGEDEKKYTTQ